MSEDARHDAFRELPKPYIAVSQPSLKGLMTFDEWQKTPPVWRLWTLAMSEMNNGGHAVFDRTELLVKLGSGGGVDPATGEVLPVQPLTARQFQKLGKRLVDGGYAVDVKSLHGRVCVQVNALIAQRSVKIHGNWECTVHRTYRRSYRDTGLWADEAA